MYSAKKDKIPVPVIKPQAKRQPRLREKPEQDPSERKDVMISYSHADKPLMLRVKEELEKHGLSVWVDMEGLGAGDNFLTKIGEAVIDSKMILPIVTPKQIESKYCRDELALAYISNKPIYPISLQSQMELFHLMNTGMRLQLASFTWTIFEGDGGSNFLESAFPETFKKLIEQCDQEVGLRKADHSATQVSDDQSIAEAEKRKRQRRLLRRQSTAETLVSNSFQDFWQYHFGDADSLSSGVFLEKFYEVHGDEIDSTFNESDKSWLTNSLLKELEVKDNGNIRRSDYINFMGVNVNQTESGQTTFIERVQEYAVESLAISEVFAMDSSVRVDAIENLGKFKSNSVVEALLDLLRDEDPNARAVALISLAKTGNNSDNNIERIQLCLEDTDRLVREAACLALGRLKANRGEVVDKIVYLWRNDVISHVRESAELALQQLESEEAKMALHITKILQDEIKLLNS